MSDRANEQWAGRTESERDTRDRLIRVEAVVENVTREVVSVRERVHTIADKQGALVLLAEEAKDDRDSLGAKLDRLDGKIDPLAVTQAQLATSYAMHTTQCAADKAGYEASIKKLSETVWRAMGGATVFWLVVTALIAFWKQQH